VKLVLDEPGTEDTRTLYASVVSIHSSRLLVPEAHAAVARAKRNGRFTRSGAQRVDELLPRLLAEVRPVELEEGVADRAGLIARKTGLRGSDAVHLASFECIEDGDALLVAADGELSRAAEALGYAIAVPGGR
jgi:predicted nucleic acid-binding protein